MLKSGSSLLKEDKEGLEKHWDFLITDEFVKIILSCNIKVCLYLCNTHLNKKLKS